MLNENNDKFGNMQIFHPAVPINTCPSFFKVLVVQNDSAALRPFDHLLRFEFMKANATYVGILHGIYTDIYISFFAYLTLILLALPDGNIYQKFLF